MNYEKISSFGDLCAVYSFMAQNLSLYYPDFEDWYWNKVVPDVTLNDGLVIVARVGVSIYGCVIMNGAKDKIRCLYVSPCYENRGIGIRLAKMAVAELGCDKPCCTVPEEIFHKLAPLLINELRFCLSQVVMGLYRPGKLEYVFNTKEDQHLKTEY